MGTNAPYMYTPSSHSGDSSRFPTTTFDPKAVTRASWEPKPARPKHDGPLVSFNKHPDAHALPPRRRGGYIPMGRYTKSAIKWLRRLQVLLRSLQLVGALGILVLMILFTKLDPITAWILRITPGVVSVHCIYAMYHLSRNAADRAPGSSAAYQIFSAAADLGAISVYAFGSFATHNDSSGWGTQLDDETLLQYLVPAAYYGLVAAGGIHLISFTVSLWLAWAFRKISLMPPDMNPLEDHLTARPMHRRNKSYLTASSDAESVKRFSAWSDVHPAAAHEFIASPRSVPFMHTRAESTESAATTYVQGDLPSRQYQIVPGNKASRRSAASMMPKRDSRPRSGNGPSYTELSTRDLSPEKTQSRDSVDHSHYPRFSEPWDSIEPTNKNSRMVRATGYSSLDARYNNEDFSDESDVEKELMDARHVYEFDMITDLHPDPLRLNPTPSKTDGAGILKTPPDSWRASDRPTNVTISDAGTNERRTEIIGGTDQPPGDRRRGSSTDTTQPGKPYSHRYGELKPGVVPIPIGSNRKTSSGNDYRVAPVSNAYERRNVSGKIAEEGRVGQRISRYNMLG